MNRGSRPGAVPGPVHPDDCSLPPATCRGLPAGAACGQRWEDFRGGGSQ
ncbi:hypothetical protein E9229_003054 [Paeniglutamicibacter cryotolerans]|uniref:Uncharacterized protein n=1 Tax=Paeniglutamicibacter cryotolerans TaxID=670079 RepID=A0A839QLS9_9MICC|nr:hypothetical protein [Paeniglutamicibacter cryotolerans]